MSDLEREKRTERILNTVILVAGVAFAVVLVVLMSRPDDEPPEDLARARAAQVDNETAQRAEQRAKARKEARERRAQLDAEDRMNEKRALWDWQDDTWFSEDVWRVKVRRGNVTIDARLDPGQGSEFTARALCDETMKRYDWAKSVRVRYRPPSGEVAARCGAA